MLSCKKIQAPFVSSSYSNLNAPYFSQIQTDVPIVVKQYFFIIKHRQPIYEIVNCLIADYTYLMGNIWLHL